MIRGLRLAVRLLIALVLVFIVGVVGFLGWMAAERPATSGRLAVAGLDKPVEIVRDGQAVPHIFAASEHDGYFALGFVHAQDRLFQMELMRRLGAGRLAELFGTVLGDWAVTSDRMMRTLGLHRRAEASLAALSPEARAAMEAYAAGVNAWMATRKEALPPEFQLLFHKPEPWRPADSMVWAKLMALQLSSNAWEELENAEYARRFSPAELRDLFPERGLAGPVTLAADLGGFDVAAILDALPRLGPSLASNEWVLAGSRTTTGKPILANDPHLGLEAPILWYLARIVTPEYSITGATSPGVPLHPLGHNGNVAWGFTTTGSDTQDLFVETLDPADPGRYLTPDGPRPFTTRQETIRVRGGEDIVLTVRETRHGPVVSDLPLARRGGGQAVPPGKVMALAFTGLAEDDTSADALYRLNHARSAAEVRAALTLYVAPQQNIAYADTAGTVGFVSPGRVPVRAAGDGTVPVPGDSSAYDWTGTIPFADLPQRENPPSGQIVNANNAVVGPEYPYLLALHWTDPARAQRIETMLGRARHSVEQTATLQTDTLSLPAREVLPHLLAVRTDGPEMAAALELLRNWDGSMRRDRPEPLIYAHWMRELVRALFADELGPLFERYWSLRPRAVAHVLSTAPRWCDDVTTPAVTETCADILTRTLRTVLDRLAAAHGADMAAWRWGDEHKAALNHRLLGMVPLLGRLTDLSVPTDGDAYSVGTGASRIADPRKPFAHVHGAGLRAVYDLDALDRSRFVIATGQSGNPLSAHWGDFTPLWAAGRSVTLAGDRETLVRAGGRVLALTPDTATAAAR